MFAAPDSTTALEEHARKLLACEDIAADTETCKRLDDVQRKQLDTDTKTVAKDLKEAVWRTYNSIVRLTKDNTLQALDLGLVHSSSATSLTELYLNRLQAQDEITENLGAGKLMKAWPPALTEWTTKSAARRLLLITFASTPPETRARHQEGYRQRCQSEASRLRHEVRDRTV